MTRRTCTGSLSRRAWSMFRVGRQALLPHRVQDAPLDGLEAVPDVGQGPRRDDRERIVEIPRLRRVVERDLIDAPGAVAADHRGADDRLTFLPRVGGFEVVEEGSIRGFPAL